MPETVPDTHQSEHEYSTGHTPDQTGVEQDEDEQQEVDQEVVDDLEMLHDGRVIIKPAGKGFFPSKPAAKAITAIIEENYHTFWHTWGMLKDEERRHMFKSFGIREGCLGGRG